MAKKIFNATLGIGTKLLLGKKKKKVEDVAVAAAAKGRPKITPLGASGLPLRPAGGGTILSDRLGS